MSTKITIKQDVEWVVAEDHPQLFECNYLNEPHEDRQTLITNPIYLQRNAEANLRYVQQLETEFTDMLTRYTTSPTPYPPCTPSRDSLLTRATRIMLGRV